jgi:hypothetical protein
MKAFIAVGLLGVGFLTTGVLAGPHEDLAKCDNLRPKACGQPGTITCKEVKEKIDACKQRVREEVGRKTNKKTNVTEIKNK